MASDEAETDIRRTLKFIGRLAVRLQSSGDSSFSEEALQKALKDAVSALPEGVVKQTLVSNPDRFAGALVDRVSSLGGVKVVHKSIPLKEWKDGVDGLLSRDLLSDSDYQFAVNALLSHSGEGKKTEKWRQLVWKIVAARDRVPDALIAAIVRIETALGREKVVVENADSATSEIAVLEAVTSSVLLRSACLPPNSRLFLLEPLVSPLEAAVQSLAKLENARSLAKRLEKSTRALLVVHSSLLKQIKGEGGRTGALLYVMVVVTKYLVLKKAGRLGESALEKLRQTATQAQAILTVEERGAITKILSSEEDSVVSSLPEEGLYAVKGALYEAALRSVSFEGVDASRDVWLRRVALARKAAKMFRANGDRSRATAISKAVLKFELSSNLGAVSTAQREKLLQFMPSEGLLNDPRGLTAWLANSADENAFDSVRDALLSEETASTSSIEAAKPDRETGSQHEAGGEGAEPLFYIDRTGGSVDPAEGAMIAAAETMRNAVSSEQLAEEKDESELSGYTEDESARGQELSVDREPKGKESKCSKGPRKKRKTKGGISSEEDESNASEGSGSSDSEMDEDDFISRMPSRPLDESSDSELEPSGEKIQKARVPLERIPIGLELPNTAEKVNLHESSEAAEAPSANKEERPAEKSDSKIDELPGEIGLPKVAVKKQGLVVSFEEREELSPLHTRSGRSVASPGPGSVSKKGLRGLGKRKEALDSVSEFAGEGSVAKGGKEAVEIEGGDVQNVRLKTPRRRTAEAASKTTLDEQVSEPKGAVEKVPTTAKKGKTIEETTGDEDYVSPLHTRSGKVLAMPSTVKKTAAKKRGAVEKLANGGEEDISPLHTRSGKVVVATPVTVKKSSATQTLPSSSKRSRKV